MVDNAPYVYVVFFTQNDSVNNILKFSTHYEEIQEY